MSEYTIRPLSSETWEAFDALGQKHNGVWNGCWCLSFQPDCPEKGRSWEGNRLLKQRLVRDGDAHAALVFDGDVAVGWCQFGTPDELPNIYHRREVDAADTAHPDYRITCLFVDRDYRRRGVATAAVAGALELIAAAGGGLVESYPQDTPWKKTSSSLLYNGTRSLFEQAGFEYDRPKGKNHCVMRKTVRPGVTHLASLHG